MRHESPAEKRGHGRVMITGYKYIFKHVGRNQGKTDDGTFSREGGIYRVVFSQGGRSPPSSGTVRSEQRAGSLRLRTETRVLAEHHASDLGLPHTVGTGEGGLLGLSVTKGARVA